MVRVVCENGLVNDVASGESATSVLVEPSLESLSPVIVDKMKHTNNKTLV